MRKRRRFSQEFKIEAVRMVVGQGRDLFEVCEDLEIRPDMLRKWIQKFDKDGTQAFPGSGRMKPEDEEIEATAARERATSDGAGHLKKSGGDLFGPAAVRYAFIDRYRHLYPVLVMCRCARGLIEWLLRVARDDRKAGVVERIAN